MKLAVCDDDLNVLKSFERMLAEDIKAGILELSVYSCADELLAACREGSFDLLFSDIILGEADGIRVAAQVCALHPSTRVVFITSHLLEYAEEIFSGVRPYGYIGKPVCAQKAEYYIRRLEKELEQSGRQLTVNIHGVECRLSMSDIRYIESEKRQVHIHCARETLTLYDRLDNIAQQLDDRFARCHQSFLVNLDWVSRLENGSLVVRAPAGSDQDDTITISRNHLRETRRRYFEYKGRSVL